MRSVRCDACGAKAMTAAAKCPKCSHLLDLRDGFGELLPLAYCSSCDSYYPERLGECKWCHTKPERPPIGPKIWRGVGAGLAAVLGGLWLIGNLTSSDTKRPRSKTNPSTVARSQSADSTTDSVKQSTPTSVVASASEDSTPPMTTSAPSAPIVLPQAVAPANEPAMAQPAASLPRTVKSNGKVEPAARRSSRWDRSVSRDWVIVRRGASKSSKIVASIGPNSRVELGESRGTWRRLKTKGVAGWVEPRNLFDVARAR
jgi:hypothetical protein